MQLLKIPPLRSLLSGNARFASGRLPRWASQTFRTRSVSAPETLAQAVVLTTAVCIQSTVVKVRREGLSDLVQILKYNRGKPSLEVLGNKAYLALCETLFHCLRDERDRVLTSKAANKGTEATKSLTLCAVALRLVIASGLRTIKSSTVEVLIETIMQVLPNRDSPRVKPLLRELRKALRLLLEHQPHVERLSLACWTAAVDFCIDSLAGSSTDAEEEASNSLSTNVSSRGRTPLESVDASMFRASPREPVSRAKSEIDGSSSPFTEEYIHCLLSLIKAANAPVLGKAEAVMTALLYLLKRRNGRGSVAAAVLAGINALLARTALQTLDLSKRIIKELLPLMKAMWSELQLRDEILITLTYTEPHITSLIADIKDTTTCVDLEALLETMYAEYRTRKENTTHQYLDEDHLCFRLIGASDASAHPLHTPVFSMENEHVKAEGLWTTVHAISSFSTLLDRRKRKLASDRDGDGESISKRARVGLLLDEYIRHISEPRSNARRAALQVVSFSIQNCPVEKDTLQTLMNKLIACMSEENATHTIWAMIALAA